MTRALNEPATALTRPPVPRELLRRSTAAGLIAVALGDLAVAAVAWVGMATLPGWSYPLLVVVVAGRLHGLGVVCHDACHLPLRRKGLAARLLELVCAYPLATTLDAMRYHHLRHHRDNGLPGDPYFKAGAWRSRGRFALLVARGALLLPAWAVRAPFGAAAWVAPALRGAYGRVFLQDASGGDLRRSREVARCAREELGLLVFLGVAGALAWRWPMAALLGYGVPATLASLLGAYRLLREHDYEPNADRTLETLLRSTYDHDLGWLGEALLAPHAVGCHLVHHLHPQVGLRHLRAVRGWYVEHWAPYPAPLERWLPGSRWAGPSS